MHHGTQRAVQVVVHLRNTWASSRKELPAALRRSSGHESSADWLTATEQRDKNVAAAYSCLFCPLFYSLFSPVLSSIRSIRSIGLLFCRPYSLTLTVRAVILFTALLSTRLLRDATVFISVDRPPCLLQESSSRPQVLLRLSSSRRPMYPRARRRLPICESIRAACRPRRHISSLTPVRPDSHQVPCGCCDFSSIPAPIPVWSIGSLSLVAPTTILTKLFFLLSLSVYWVRVWACGSLFSSSLCSSLLLYRLNLAGHARSFFTVQLGKWFSQKWPLTPTVFSVSLFSLTCSCGEVKKNQGVSVQNYPLLSCTTSTGRFGQSLHEEHSIPDACMGDSTGDLCHFGMTACSLRCALRQSHLKFLNFHVPVGSPSYEWF